MRPQAHPPFRSIQILAVYSPNIEDRIDLLTTLKRAQDWSFGPGYKSSEGMVQACWDVYDNLGNYEHGIAPWREAMTATGRSLYL